jgi:hypothetical protein
MLRAAVVACLVASLIARVGESIGVGAKNGEGGCEERVRRAERVGRQEQKAQPASCFFGAERTARA